MATAPCVQETLPCIQRQSLVPGLLFLYAAAALCVREHLPHTRRWPLVFGGPSIHAATATCVGEPVPYTRQRPLVSGNSVPITAHRVCEPLPPFSSFLFSASGGLFSSLVFLSFSSQCFRMLSFVPTPFPACMLSLVFPSSSISSPLQCSWYLFSNYDNCFSCCYWRCLRCYRYCGGE